MTTIRTTPARFYARVSNVHIRIVCTADPLPGSLIHLNDGRNCAPWIIMEAQRLVSTSDGKRGRMIDCKVEIDGGDPAPLTEGTPLTVTLIDPVPAVLYESTFSRTGHSCAVCGWPVIYCNANGPIVDDPQYAGADTLAYCGNPVCRYHHPAVESGQSAIVPWIIVRPVIADEPVYSHRHT